MNLISNFYTLFWIIYFPTCIAYNDLPGLGSVDELMTIALIGFTFLHLTSKVVNGVHWKEYFVFLGILGFYTVYSLLWGENVQDAVYLDFIQEIRPYSVIFCTLILNPKFSKRQKNWMLASIVLTLFSWIFYHPVSEYEAENGVQAEFPVLGQLAICAGMAWYLLTSDTSRNKRIAMLLVLTGLIAPKFKFLGEVVLFIYLLFFMRNKFDFKSSRTVATFAVLTAIILTITWTRFDQYYYTGFTSDLRQARPETYKTALLILKDYIPFGPGMGTFACNGAWRYYSPLYPKYDLDTVWGLDQGGGFICDAFYPTLAQFGIVGVFLFCWFWKRRLQVMNAIVDMRYYRVAWMAFFCLAIEQTADSSWLSGKGMGYCMLLALCLNANRNQGLPDEPNKKVDRVKGRWRLGWHLGV